MPGKAIAFIAPFEGIAIQAEQVIKTNAYPARVWRGDLAAGVQAASDALKHGAKVIVSRGGTAKQIQAELGDRLSIAVIEVEASVYNVIRYVHERARPDFRMAVVGFPQFTIMGRAVCESMEVNHRIFEITNEATAALAVRTLVEWRADAVIGDTVSCRLMSSLGWENYHLIESSLYSIRDAFERAMLVLDNLERQIAHNRKLTTVLACSLQGVAIIDKDGVVEDINHRCVDLLGMEANRIVGKNMVKIIADPDLEAALRKKTESRGNLLDLNGEQLIVDLVPLASEGQPESGSMVMTVQPSKRIQEMENAIRTRMHKKGFHARHVLDDIIHGSSVMADAIAMASEYARSDANIIITGETGTGKELFAQGIHNASPRSDGMFVAINCAALPSGLLESELFGYSPGAFTGALKSGKPGLFEIAHKGTLFLDEISEMEPFLQTRLLRAIQEGEIMRLGDSRMIPVDVRIIAAANKDLAEEVDRGNLRMDLFFRLNVLSLRLPPLRERRGDIELLLKNYLIRHAAKMGVRLRLPDAAFFQGLERYGWPGNVRELENLAERYVVLQNRPESADFRVLLPRFGKERDTDAILREAGKPQGEEKLDDVIRDAIAKALEAENGNIVRASRRLGVNRNTVKRWMRKADGE